MFSEALAVILKFEGGYANDPDDPGGATNKGITQKTFDSYLKVKGSDSRPVRFITDAEVKDIYDKDYWRAVRADRFDDTHPSVALCHFDTGVNQGTFVANKLLQQAINKASVTDDKHLIMVDGIIGQKTLEALRACNELDLLNCYLDLRRTKYETLFVRNPKLLKWKKSYQHRMNTLAVRGRSLWRWVD